MLKKIAISFAAVAVMAAGAYAGYVDISTLTALAFKPSNNVTVMYLADTAATSAQSYVIASKNTAGDTIYATSNISTTIYKITPPTVAGTSGPGVKLADNEAHISKLVAGESLFTDWTAM